MDKKIIESVVEITRQRDVDSLEYSLVATLAELVPSNTISLNKLCSDIEDGNMEQAIKFSRVEKENGELTFEWSTDPILKPIENTVRLYIDTKEVVFIGAKSNSQLVVPLFLKKALHGTIHIICKDDLSPHISLIEGLIRIYSNYLFILDESEHDKLTGLYNRRTFEKKLHRLLSIQKNKKIEMDTLTKDNQRLKIGDDTLPWLAIVDIDHFKDVNDTWGHVIGDEVLLRVSQIMQETFRKSDMLFRFGGEEFLILLEPIPESMAMQVLDRFREKIAHEMMPRVEHITLSIGFTQVIEGQFPTDILERADRALYFAKNNGRDAVYLFEALIREEKLADRAVATPVELF